MIQSRTGGSAAAGSRAGRFRWALAVAAGLAAVATARGQAPDPEPARGPGARPGPRQVADLTTRYRLVESYFAEGPRGAGAPAAKAPRPGELNQYRVATRDVLRVVSEKPQGTPDRQETTVQVIYSERAAAVNETTGAVTDTVRRYEAFQVTPAPEAKPSVPKPMDKLTVWVRPRADGGPLVMTLDSDRALTETEYAVNSQILFLPDLSAVLPALPSRVGDRWRIPRAAGRALLGDRPASGGEPLVGTLQDVVTAPDGSRAAVITVSGHAKMPPNGSDTAVNAQIVFAFRPPAAPASPAGEAAPVEARGAITEVRLARSSTSALPGTSGRLRRTFTWEMTLQRKVSAPGPDLIAVPSTPPAPSPANSWLTYDDPRGRFHFRHPQDLRPQRDPVLEQDGTVQLIDDHAGATEGRVLTLKLQPRTGQAEADKNNRDPDFQLKELNDEWKRSRQDVLRGPAGWLPPADWEPHKMRVHRIEAAVRPAGAPGKDAPRIFLDHYLILFTQNESLVVDAMTGQDPPLPFREQVEQILKTFRLGPSRGPEG